MDAKIKMSAVNLDVLNEVLADKGLKPAKAAKTAVSRYIRWFDAYEKEHALTPDDVLVCSTCNAPSDSSFDICPVCGDDGEGDEATSDEASSGEAEDDEASSDEASSDEASSGEAEDDEASSDEVEEDEVEEDEVEEDEVEEDEAEVVKKAEVIKVGPSDLGQYTVKDLNASVRKITTLLSKGEELAYQIGVRLKEIHQKQLWKLRLDDDNKPLYRSFEKFALTELGLGKNAAYHRIDVADNFTPEDVKEIGYSKLALLLKAPEAYRGELKEAVVTNDLSWRDLQKEVKGIRSDEGVTRIDHGRKKTPASKGKAKANLAVAQLIGKSTVPLYRKAKKGEPLEQATNVDENPFCAINLPGDMVEIIMILKKVDKETGEEYLYARISREKKKTARKSNN